MYNQKKGYVLIATKNYNTFRPHSHCRSANGFDLWSQLESYEKNVKECIFHFFFLLCICSPTDNLLIDWWIIMILLWLLIKTIGYKSIWRLAPLSFNIWKNKSKWSSLMFGNFESIIFADFLFYSFIFFRHGNSSRWWR